MLRHNPNNVTSRVFAIMNHGIAVVRRNYVASVVLVFTATAVLLGLYARFKGLGKWSLANDEFLIAYSVNQILDLGYPALESGGFYTRSIVYQYLQAFVLLLSGLPDELSLRMVNAIFSVATMPALFLLTRRLGGLLAACLALTLFSLSIWEVETARYVRMYAPFQMLFVWYLLALYRVVIDQDRKPIRWMYVLSIVSVFVYEGGIFLVLLNFLPLFLDPRAPRWRSAAPATVILIAAFTYLQTDFRSADIVGFVPNVAVAAPTILLANMKDPIWLLGLALLALSLAKLAARVLSCRTLNPRSKVVLILCCLFALLNQYGLIVYLLLLAWLIDWIRTDTLRLPVVKNMTMWLFSTLAFWLVFALSTSGWYGLLPDQLVNVNRRLLTVLVGFPDVYWSIIYLWIKGIPVLTTMSVLCIAAGLWLSVRSESLENHGYKVLLAILVVLGLLVAVLPTPFHAAKYTLFLYPLVLSLSSVAIKSLALGSSRSSLARGSVFLIFSATFVTLSDDHSWHHLSNVDKKEVNFRQIYELPRQYHYWYRMDYLTPAQYVNQHLCEEDLVVLIHSVVSTYYLRQSDYLYETGPLNEFTDAKPLKSPDELFALLNRSKKTIWLIMRTENYPYRLDIEADLSKRYAGYHDYRSLDGRIDVYRLGRSPNLTEGNSGAQRTCETITDIDS